MTETTVKRLLRCEFRRAGKGMGQMLEWEGIYWIYLAQDKDQSRALVNSVMNLVVPEHVGKSLSS
jgi:hypothetical protein